MFDPTYDLQVAMFQTLKANAAVMAVANAVLDFVPQSNSPPYPFILIGEDQTKGDLYQDAATSTVWSTVHIWSAYKGRKEAKQIARAVIPVLGQRLNIGNCTCYSGMYCDSKDVGDPTEGLQHLVLTFEYRLGPSS